jgi:DNA polymerase-1
MPKLYLIDGSGFIFRAYHALPPLTAPDGTPVGAVVGFVNMLLKLRQEHKGDYMAVIFDAARKTFRNRIYEAYKANRPPAPEDLVPQFPIVREATVALGLPAIELADYEADDIIATYARLGREAGMEVVIVSSDKDLMQLIGEGVALYDAMKQKNIGAPEVLEKFGVAPEKVRHVLALMGDSSDNVPGVPGIGPKTAAELIGQYGDLETLLSRAGEIKQNKRRETIQANVDQARISYELIGLKDDVPLPVPLESLAVADMDAATAIAFCAKYGLKTAMARIQGKQGIRDQASGIREAPPPSEPSKISSPNPQSPIPNASYSILRSEAELAAWIARAQKKGVVAFDTETTSLNALQAELVGFSLCIEAGAACYVPLAHKVTGDGIRVTESNHVPDLFSPLPVTCHLSPGQISFDRALALIKTLLEDESVLKIGHNIKYDMLVMGNYGVAINAVEDTMLLSYCLHAGEHGQGMDELAERYLHYKTISFDEVTGTGKNRKRFDEVDIEKAAPYAAEDADVTMRLYQHFKPQLAAQKMLALYETIERPLISVLARMEQTGIKVDVAKLAGLSKDFEQRMHELEREIHRLAGAEFNVGSPKQLGEILFDKLQLEGGRKSAKTGAYSTDNEVLEELADQGHEIAVKTIEWRQLAKLKGTYSDALANQINPKTRRVHTSFAQSIASTGRLSSSDPNLQNIPIRSVEGKKIRDSFVAEPGNVLLSADYSQIELRLLAHMADIPTLKEAFKNGDDIHAITASQMFGVPVNQVDGNLRRSAKTINFGIIYGISAHGLATRLGIGRSEAATYIGQYFQQYPGIRDYMESCKEFARTHGYVATLFGRRCHVPGINDKNAARRQFFERAAINAPLQGTAADIIKKAMIAIDNELKNWRNEELKKKESIVPQFLNSSIPQFSCNLLLQVHDELVFEVKNDAQAIAQATDFVKQAMEGAAQLSVPLTVETGTGSHWGEAH